LSIAAAREQLIIVRITEEGEVADGLLQFCYEHSLKPGCRIEVIRTGDTSLTIKLEDGKILEISSAFAKYICCSFR
jgi:hypothetical protein